MQVQLNVNAPVTGAVQVTITPAPTRNWFMVQVQGQVAVPVCGRGAALALACHLAGKSGTFPVWVY